MGNLGLFFVVLHGIATATDEHCDPAFLDCNMVTGKVPAVTATLQVGAVTSSLVAEDRVEFEHMLGHALAETEAVRLATRSFASRVRRFVVEGAALNGSTVKDALLEAFAPPSFGRHNAGFVGPSVDAIERVLASGNIR